MSDIIFGKWYAYAEAPAGSYACLVSRRSHGQWNAPVMQWMPASGRGVLAADCAVTPFLMPSDPLAWRDTLGDAAGGPDVGEELRLAAALIRTWMPETLPADENGQIHFARVLAESAAEAIEQFLALPAASHPDSKGGA